MVALALEAGVESGPAKGISRGGEQGHFIAALWNLRAHC